MHALGMRCGCAESASEKIFKELFGKRSSLRISVYTIYTVTACLDTAETLTSRGVALVFWVVGYKGRLLPALLSPSFCIYCPKNEEYCLDIASLEYLRHKKNRII
jgi:hypothetical protein